MFLQMQRRLLQKALCCCLHRLQHGRDGTDQPSASEREQFGQGCPSSYHCAVSDQNHRRRQRISHQPSDGLIRHRSKSERRPELGEMPSHCKSFRLYHHGLKAHRVMK